MAGERRQASQHPKQQQVTSDLPSQESGVCLDRHLSGGKKSRTDFILFGISSNPLAKATALVQRAELGLGRPPW